MLIFSESLLHEPFDNWGGYRGPEVLVIRTLKIFREFGMASKSESLGTNWTPRQKRVHLERMRVGVLKDEGGRFNFLLTPMGRWAKLGKNNPPIPSRRISHWNWKLRILPRTLRFPSEKLSFQFFTNSGLQVSIWRKKDILIYPMPIPWNPLITFINIRSFPGLGRFELLTHASELGRHITSKTVRKSLFGEIFLYNADNQYLQPTDHPNPQSWV